MPDSNQTPLRPEGVKRPPAAGVLPRSPGEGAPDGMTARSINEIAAQLEALQQATRRLEHEREEACRRERHLGFVRDLAHRSGGRVPLDEFLCFCAQRLRDLLDLQDCAVVLMAPGQVAPEAVATADEKAAGDLAALFADDAVTRRVLSEGGELQSDRLLADPRFVAASLCRWHGGALFALPLLGVPEAARDGADSDQPFGVLHLARPAPSSEPRSEAFSAAELTLAREVAYEVALAVDSARRFRAMEQEARQIERSREEIRSYFNQVGAAMSSALNLNQLLRLIVSVCIRITQAHGGSLYLIENHRLRQQVVIGMETGPEAAGKVHVRESLLGWESDASRAAEPPASLTAWQTDRYPASPARARRSEVQSFLGVPLVIKEEVKGQLNIYTRDRRDFTAEEVALLTAFAGQAALAIENAQIFEFESQRAREATLLYKAARAIGLSNQLDDVLDISVHQLLRITAADRCLIFLANQRRSEFRVARSVGLSRDQEEFFSVFRLASTHFSADIMDSLTSGRQIYLTTPPANCPALARLFTLLPTNAFLLVPLLAKETLLGLIFLDDSKITRYFDASQVRMVMTLSIQIATAVQRARLLSELEEKFDQLKALHEVSTAVTGTLSLPKVLDLVLEKAVELLGTQTVHEEPPVPPDLVGRHLRVGGIPPTAPPAVRRTANPACALLVSMGEQDPLRLQGARGVPEALNDAALQNLIARAAVLRKRPTTFYLAGGEERLRDEGAAPLPEEGGLLRIAEALQEAKLGGLLAVPLIARRKIVGVLNCFAPPGGHFSAPEIRLMRSFANQAAAALENARLHDVVKNKMHELAALFEIGKAITSTLQLERVLESITESVHRVMNADACAIMLLDSLKRQLSVKTALGLGPHHTQRTIRLGRGIAGVAAKTGRPMIMVDEEGSNQKKFPDSVRRDGLRTILSVPMEARGRIVGLINVYYKKIHYHQPSEMSLLTTLSAQAAIAIENARLYEEKNQVSEMLRNLLLPREKFQHPRVEVGHRFISSFELSGDYYDVIALGEARAAFCIADVAGKGPKAAIYAARAKYVLKSYVQAGASPREVVTWLNRLLAPETESEMFITLFYADVDLERGVLTYASAGHEPPILWRAGRKKCRLLQPRDILVGVDRDYRYAQRRVPIGPRDLLVLYTDGVTEARGGGEEAFGLARVQELVEEHSNLPAQLLANKITAAVQRHAHRKLNDDFSLMVVRML